jgi:hypothetical protein
VLLCPGGMLHVPKEAVISLCGLLVGPRPYRDRMECRRSLLDLPSDVCDVLLGLVKGQAGANPARIAFALFAYTGIPLVGLTRIRERQVFCDLGSLLLSGVKSFLVKLL